MAKFKHAIVVGGTSGIGMEVACQLAEQGCRVAVLGRRKERLDKLAAKFPELILPFEHDVTHYDEVPTLFQEITGQLGGLDLIVYSSGVMPQVELDEYDFAKDRAMVETNFLGAIAWLNEAAVRFSNTGHGSLVAIGSVAGDRGRQKQPVYNASKAALHTYMEALRNRLARKGVKVVTIKPGPVETDMIAGLDFKNAMPVSVAASKIIKQANKTGEHYLSLTHAIIFAAIRNVPSWIFRRLSV